MRTIFLVLLVIALVFAQDASDSSVDNGLDPIPSANLPTDLQNIDLGELKPIVEGIDPENELEQPVPASQLLDSFGGQNLTDLKDAIEEFDIELPEFNLDAAAVGALRAKHRAAVAGQLLQLLAADPAAIKTAIAAAHAKLADATANFTAAKEDLIADVKANITIWKARVQEAIANRTEALSSSTTWEKRAQLALLIYKARLLRAYVAAHVVAAHAIAANAERLHRAFKAEVIALKAVLTFRELVANGTITVDADKAQELFGKVVNLIAERRTWAEISLIRLKHILLAINRFVDRLKFLNDNLDSRVARLKKRVTFAKVRQALAGAPAEVKERLRESIRQVIEHVRDAEVTLSGLVGSGDITIDITINRVSKPGDDTTAIKDEIKKLLKALLLAETGAPDDDVVITDPVVPAQKRADSVSVITTSAKISGGATPPADAATSVVLSVVAILAAIAVLF